MAVRVFFLSFLWIAVTAARAGLTPLHAFLQRPQSLVGLSPRNQTVEKKKDNSIARSETFVS